MFGNGDEKDAIQLRNVDIHAKIYAYCKGDTPCSHWIGCIPTQYDPDLHGKPVYVGLTSQDLKDRDAQHLSSTTGTFDRQYKNRSQYVLVVLISKHFAAAVRDENFKDDTLHPAGSWMDYWETMYIAKFDTYHTGLNSTRGGQGRGWMMTMREGIAKAAYLRFQNVYMPAIPRFIQVQGSYQCASLSPHSWKARDAHPECAYTDSSSV